MAIGAGSWLVLFAVETFLGYGRWSLAGGFSSWFLSFSFNISGVIGLIIRGVNSNRNIQVYQFIVDMIVGEGCIDLDIINNIIH